MGLVLSRAGFLVTEALCTDANQELTFYVLNFGRVYVSVSMFLLSVLLYLLQFPFTDLSYVKLSALTVYSFKIHNTDPVSIATQLHSIVIRSLLPADLSHSGIGMWHVCCPEEEIKLNSETAFPDSLIHFKSSLLKYSC